MVVAAPIGAVVEYEAAVTRRLFEIAQQFNIDSPVVRDILPQTDLNALSGEFWQQDVSTLGYAMNYSGTLENDKAVVIFGAKQAGSTQRSTVIRFYDGVGRVSVKDLWNIEADSPKDPPISLAEPNSLIAYLPSSGFNIDFYGKLAGRDRVILLGKTVEPRGRQISPKTE